MKFGDIDVKFPKKRYLLGLYEVKTGKEKHTMRGMELGDFISDAIISGKKNISVKLLKKGVV